MLTKYQRSILDEMKNGAVIKCTEGKNYKVWLKYPNGKIKNIRRDSATKITTIDNFESYFTFGDEIKLVKHRAFEGITVEGEQENV